MIRISDTPLSVEESTKFLGLWWDSHLSFNEHLCALKVQCKEALNLIRVVAHLKWRGDRDTLLVLYRTIVHSKLDYGCIVYGTASNTNSWQHPKCWAKTGTRGILQQPSLQYVHGGQRSSFGGTSVEAVHELLSENLSPCTDNPAQHTLHEFDPTTRDLYLPRPNGKAGMRKPPAQPIGLKIQGAMTSAEIDVGTVCPLKIPTFTPGTHEYDPKKHSLIKGVSKCMITKEEAQAKFREYYDAQDWIGLHLFNNDTRPWGHIRCSRPTWWCLHWRI